MNTKEDEVGTVPMSMEEITKLMESVEGEDAGRTAAQASRPTPSQEGLTDSSPLSLREFVNAEQLKRDVEFNTNDLDNAVQSHASLFVHYSNLARLARRQYAKMTAAFEIMESRLDHHWRTVLKESGKATENQIESAVKADPRWWAAQKKLIDSRAIHDLANDAKSAFEHRRDMIVQVSVDRRTERQGQVRVMGNTEAVASARENALAAEQRRRDAAGG